MGEEYYLIKKLTKNSGGIQKWKNLYFTAVLLYKL